MTNVVLGVLGRKEHSEKAQHMFLIPNSCFGVQKDSVFEALNWVAPLTNLARPKAHRVRRTSPKVVKTFQTISIVGRLKSAGGGLPHRPLERQPAPGPTGASRLDASMEANRHLA